MRRILYWALGIIGALIVAVAIFFAFFFQWGWLKGPLEAGLSSATGKTVHIDGAVDGHLGWPTVRFSIDGIRVEAPGWKPDPTVAKIARIVVAINVWRYLRGTVAIPYLEVDKPVIALERRPDGSTNWAVAKEASGPSSRASVPVLGTLKIEGGKLSYQDPAKNTSIDATLATVQASGGSGSGPIELRGKGSYQGSPFSLTLRGGPLFYLRDTSKPYNVDLSADLGRSHVRATGTVTDPVKMVGLDVKLTLDGQNAAELYPYLGVPAPDTPPFHLTGQLGRKGRVWSFDSFSGKVGHSDLQGSIHFDTGRKRPYIEGDLVSKSLTFVDLGLLVGAPTKVEGANDGAVSEEQKKLEAAYHKSDRVLPNAPLRIDMVHSVDANITFKGTHIVAKDVPLENVKLRLRIDNGVLTLDPLDIGVAGGRVSGGVSIDAHTDRVKTDYNLHLSQFQLRHFLERAGLGKYASGTINGRIELKGTGDSVRKSLGTADGHIAIIVDDGEISALGANLIGLDLAKALGFLITGDKKIDLRCMVLDFGVKNGVMAPRAFVIDTSANTIYGGGTIDLRHEALDLQISGKPKKPTPLELGGPILVDGTIKKPKIGLGAKAIVRGGAEAVLSPLTAPLTAIMNFIDPNPNEKENANCAALESKARQPAE